RRALAGSGRARRTDQLAHLDEPPRIQGKHDDAEDQEGNVRLDDAGNDDGCIARDRENPEPDDRLHEEADGKEDQRDVAEYFDRCHQALPGGLGMSKARTDTRLYTRCKRLQVPLARKHSGSSPLAVRVTALISAR